MRHGYLSDIHGNNLLSTPSPKEGESAPEKSESPPEKGESTQTKCPHGHYISVLKTAQPPRAVRAPSHQAVIGRIAKAPYSGVAVRPEQDAIEESFGKIADARASGVDNPPDDDFGNIPAGYTYFGQLVVHDLTHSAAIAGREGRPPTLENLSTPSLDLDTIYGGGPRRRPHLYQPAYLDTPLGSNDPGQHLFYLGRTAHPALPENAQAEGGKPLDLPRIDTTSRGIAATTPSTSVTPLVHDDRNDDNLVLSQLTTQFLLVHNKVANYLYRNGDATRGNQPLDKTESFELARHFLLKAYRRIVVHDYLQRLLFEPIYTELMGGGMERYDRLPIEFIFGVARTGHAMVRAAYKINMHVDLELSGLGRLMAFSSSSPGARLPLPADWVVNWSLLLEMEPGDRPQSARRISPFLAPTFVHGDLRSRRTGLKGSLSFHDLWRCHQFGVPTGQECAQELLGSGSKYAKYTKYILTADRMMPPQPFVDLHPADNLVNALEKNEDFRKNTPLSYYLVQEAALHGDNGRVLGPLGSLIFARTILYALSVAPQHYETPAGQTELTFDQIREKKGIFKLPDLLNIVRTPDDRLGITIAETLA